MADVSSYRKTLEKGGDSKKRATAVTDLFTVFLDQQRQHRLTWLGCSAFARGIQHAVLDEDDRLVVPMSPEGVKISKVNKIKPWKRHMLSRVTRARPEFEVIPSGDLSIEKLDAAQAGTAFLQHNARRVNDWVSLRYKVTSYCIDFGTMFIYIRDEENPYKRTPRLVYDIVGEKEIDPETGQQRVELINVIDIKWEALLPHNVLFDLKPSHIDGKYEVILGFYRDLSYFDLVYNKSVKPDKSSKSIINYDLTMLSRTRESAKEMEGALELVYLRKPNRRDKDGRMTIVVGNEVLDDKKWPYQYMTGYPLVKYCWDEPPPGEFYTQSPIEDQIPIQKDINEAYGIIQENISNVGHVKWMNPIGSNVATIDDIAGEIVDYNVGKEPHQAQLSPLPDYLVGHPARLSKDLEDIQLHHSVSRGEGTPNVRSAVGLDRLEEEDNEPLNIIDDFFLSSDQELAVKTLKIAVEKMTVPQLIKYVGEGRRRTISNFRGEMLDPDSTVSVRMVDTYLRHKGTAQKLIIEMAHNNLIGTDSLGRPDITRIQKMLRFAIPEMMWDKEDKQREMALDENEQIMDGTDEVFAERWEFHLIHIETHEELLNSREFKLQNRQDPELRKRAVEHWGEHRQFLMEAMGGRARKQETSEREVS